MGGAGTDHLFGGRGKDTLDGGTGADIAYGGDGDDRLIADVPDDRLIDWFGNFNDFVVPGPGYGAPTIVRSPSPWVRDFLLDLAVADGALDPNGEIVVVIPGSPDQQGNSGKGGRTK
jgi:Ca2+-binding RTX toxin-like protein